MPAGESQPREESQEQRPPGHFVSDEHEADCHRFLAEIKEFVRRQTEAGLSASRRPR